MLEYIIPAVKGILAGWAITKIIILDKQINNDSIEVMKLERKSNSLTERIKVTEEKLTAKDINVIKFETNSTFAFPKRINYTLNTDDNLSIGDVFKHSNRFYKVVEFVGFNKEEETITYICEGLYWREYKWINY